MTRPRARIASRTGQGSGAAPARSAAIAWPASSLFICATIAREARSVCRQPLEMARQVLLDLALGLDDEAEAGRVAERGRRRRPMPNAPQYQSGLSRLGRAPSSRSRSAVQARWSVSSRGGLGELAAQRGVGRGQRLRAVERLRADLADVIDAHQGARPRAARRRRAARPAAAGRGFGTGRPAAGWRAPAGPGRRPASKRSAGCRAKPVPWRGRG